MVGYWIFGRNGYSMNIQQLKSQIQTKTLNNFYVFTGDEWQVQKLYIKQIAKVKNQKIKYVDSIKDIYSTLGSRSFIQEYYCYVIRDDKEIMTNEKLQHQLLLENLVGKNTLILLITHLDKRTKTFRAFEDINIVFDKLPLDQLKNALKQICSLSDKNLERLIDICEYDYGRILLEIDKVKQIGPVTFTGIAGNYDADATLDMLINDRAIYIPPRDAIFDLVDAILKHQIKRIYQLLDDCYRIGESKLVILSVLYDNAKQVLQVQSYEGEDIERATGLTKWQIKNAKIRSGNYSIGELVEMLRAIRNIEKGIKIGEIEESISIELLLTRVL